jgi:hypothetical protein
MPPPSCLVLAITDADIADKAAFIEDVELALPSSPF